MIATDLDRFAAGLGAALLAAGRAAATARDPWWVIGSAALALHGVDPGPIRDVDLLTSARDGRALLDRAGVSYCNDSADDRFRSATYGRWRAGALEIEVMGDLDVNDVDGWRRLQPETREAIMVDGVALYVPSRAEMVTILHAFGREKDLRRAALLSAA